MRILLDYFFPVSVIEPIPAASTSFIHNVVIFVLPKSGVPTGTIVKTHNMSEVAALTDNTDAAQLFNAGMTTVYVLPTGSLDVFPIDESNGANFYTALVSSDFDESYIPWIDTGPWKGVVGVSSDNDDFLELMAASGFSAWKTNTTNKAKNMFYAFGKLLSNQTNWLNQQYISMPFDDGIKQLGDANSLFDEKISFVLTDDYYGPRLALFQQGYNAIIAPYVKENLIIDMQSKGLQYVANNMPNYTKTEAALIEDELQKVIQQYKDRKWIEDGDVEVNLYEGNWVANAEIVISDPKALWRIFAEMKTSVE